MANISDAGFCWYTNGESLVRGDRLTEEMRIPFGQGADHAEGIAIVPDAGPPSQILVVYDSPSAERKKGVADAVRADVFLLAND